MIRPLALFVSLALVAACGSKEPAGKAGEAKPEAAEPEAAEPEAAEPEVPADARRVAIDVGSTGYEPATVPAKPGEPLVLVFTRTVDTHCGRYVKLKGSDDAVELPLDQAVDFPVTAPDTGEVVFTCGMDMMHGVVVAEAPTGEGGEAGAPE